MNKNKKPSYKDHGASLRLHNDYLSAKDRIAASKSLQRIKKVEYPIDIKKQNIKKEIMMNNHKDYYKS